MSRSAVGGKLRVVQVVQEIDRGGLEMMAVELAVALQQRGIESAVVGLDGGGRLEARLARAHVPFYNFGGAHFASPGTHARMFRLLRDLGAMVVHTHHLPPLLNAVPAARVARVGRVVHTEHAFQYLEHAPSHRRLTRLAALGVDAFAVVGAAMLPFYASRVGVPRDRLHVVVNGIDTDRFTPGRRPPTAAAVRAEHDLDGADLVVGAVGRLAMVKNYPLLLRAAARARAQGADVRVVLVGDGEERGALEALASELGGAGAFAHFLGWRTDVADLLPAFDVLAVTSVTEGLPLVVLEAMASGVPVVSTGVGDIPAVLQDGAAGVLCPEGNEVAFADALSALAHDAAGRAGLATRARARVEQAYSQRAMVDTYCRLYGLDTDGAEEARVGGREF